MLNAKITAAFSVGARHASPLPTGGAELLVRFADAIADEPADDDILAGLGRGLCDELADAHGRIANRRLLHEDELGVEAPELALDDLVEHVRRLAAVLHLRPVDRLLLLDRL